MEMDVAKQPGKQRTREEIISLVEEYRKTKMSAKDFATIYFVGLSIKHRSPILMLLLFFFSILILIGIYSAIVDYDASSHNKKIDLRPKPSQSIEETEFTKGPIEPLKNSKSMNSDELTVIDNPPLENIYVSPEQLKKLEESLKSK